MSRLYSLTTPPPNTHTGKEKKSRPQVTFPRQLADGFRKPEGNPRRVKKCFRSVQGGLKAYIMVWWEAGRGVAGDEARKKKADLGKLWKLCQSKAGEWHGQTFICKSPSGKGATDWQWAHGDWTSILVKIPAVLKLSYSHLWSLRLQVSLGETLNTSFFHFFNICIRFNPVKTEWIILDQGERIA